MITKSQEIEQLRREFQPCRFEFILRNRDTEVLRAGCDFRNLKFIMDSIELRQDFLRWFPSRQTIEIQAKKLYASRGERRKVYRVRDGDL